MHLGDPSAVCQRLGEFTLRCRRVIQEEVSSAAADRVRQCKGVFAAREHHEGPDSPDRPGHGRIRGRVGSREAWGRDDAEEARGGEVDAVPVKELTHRRRPEPLPPCGLGGVGGRDSYLDDGRDGCLPVACRLHDRQSPDDAPRGGVGHARRLFRVEAGELHRRAERPVTAGESERQPYRPAVGDSVGGLDAEHGVGVPQESQLLVTCGVGGEKRHVGTLSGAVLYWAAFAADPAPSCARLQRFRPRNPGDPFRLP